MATWSGVTRLLDVIMVLLGAVLAYMLRFHGTLVLGDIEKLMIAFHCALVLLVFPSFGVYRSWRGRPASQLIWRTLGAWGLVMAIGLCVIFSMHRTDAVSRLWVGLTTAIAAVLLIVGKLSVMALLRGLRRQGMNQKTVAIVGSESHRRAILDHIRQAPYAGFKPLWGYDEHAGAVAGQEVGADGIEVITRFDALVARVRNRQVDEIWMALPFSDQHTIHQFMREFRHDFVNLRFLPDVRSVSVFNHGMTEILGMPAIDVAACPMAEPALWLKQAFDRVIAALALALMLPLLLVLAVLVKQSSPGPALFRQKRRGIDGRPFEILKFRTMKIHAETPGHVVQATRDDARVTRLGAFLRHTNLDELPQLVNVLKGQMSLVGPRPHAIEHDDLYKDLVEGYMYRYRIKPGITGWAQVNGYRGETRKVDKMEARVKFDLFYIQNWTFWFDVEIILLTLVRTFGARNAY
jgi:putative colanic acid biosysnthesis UDP-glucose lipid carrier transferase